MLSKVPRVIIFSGNSNYNVFFCIWYLSSSRLYHIMSRLNVFNLVLDQYISNKILPKIYLTWVCPLNTHQTVMKVFRMSFIIFVIFIYNLDLFTLIHFFLLDLIPSGLYFICLFICFVSFCFWEGYVLWIFMTYFYYVKVSLSFKYFLILF